MKRGRGVGVSKEEERMYFDAFRYSMCASSSMEISWLWPSSPSFLSLFLSLFLLLLVYFDLYRNVSDAVNAANAAGGGVVYLSAGPSILLNLPLPLSLFFFFFFFFFFFLSVAYCFYFIRLLFLVHLMSEDIYMKDQEVVILNDGVYLYPPKLFELR